MSRDTLLVNRALGELRAAADAFRLGMDAQANHSFAQAIEAVASWYAQVGGDRTIEGLLAGILEAQERGDTLALADALEFSLIPSLRAADQAQADAPEERP